MERNQLIGLVLMLVFITVYFKWFAPEPAQPKPVSEITSDTLANQSTSTTAIEKSAAPLSDSALSKLNEQKFGAFSSASIGSEQETVIENDHLQATFTSKGAAVKKIVLKDFKDFRGNPLVLLDSKHAEQHLYLDHLNRKIDLAELHFSTDQASTTIQEGDTTKLNYTLKVGNASIIYQYTIPGSGYEIGLSIRHQGLESLIGKEIQFAWKQKMNRLEKDFKDARDRSTVKFHLEKGDVEELSPRSTEKEEDTFTEPVNWVSFRQKFFASAIISEKPFQKGYVSSNINYSDTTSVKNVEMSLALPYDAFIANQSDFKFFYGPINYSILKDVAPDFSENVELGWFVLRWINKFAIIPIFHFLEKFISNYGVIIIIMVFILRLFLAPLTYKSHMGMAKMRVMKPELDEIKAKHGDDMTKAQQEQMALYQKVGINPLSGCIPMLLQMPILFAMFYFFPNSIELRQEAFLWADDLSTYDSILNLPFTIPFYGDHVSLFTLLMTASTLLYTWSNSQMTTVQGPMKTVQYVMPITFLFFLNSYSAGLTFYYFVSNLVSFGQMALFRKLIDEDKIKQTLDENRKKNANKKKGSFQQRLEDAMKAQQNNTKNKKTKKKS